MFRGPTFVEHSHLFAHYGHCAKLETDPACPVHLVKQGSAIDLCRN